MAATATLSADGNADFAAWETIAPQAGAEKPVTVYDDFGGGTLTMKYSVDDGTTYVDVDSALCVWTDDGGALVRLPKNALPRFVLSGATSPDLKIQVGD